eukprot:16272_1
MYLTLFVFVVFGVINVHSACSVASLSTFAQDCTCTIDSEPGNCADLEQSVIDSGYSSLGLSFVCDEEGSGLCTLECESDGICSQFANFVQLSGATCIDNLCRVLTPSPTEATNPPTTSAPTQPTTQSPTYYTDCTLAQNTWDLLDSVMQCPCEPDNCIALQQIIENDAELQSTLGALLDFYDDETIVCGDLGYCAISCNNAGACSAAQMVVDGDLVCTNGACIPPTATATPTDTTATATDTLTCQVDPANPVESVLRCPCTTNEADNCDALQQYIESNSALQSGLASVLEHQNHGETVVCGELGYCTLSCANGQNTCDAVEVMIDGDLICLNGACRPGSSITTTSTDAETTVTDAATTEDDACTLPYEIPSDETLEACAITVDFTAHVCNVDNVGLGKLKRIVRGAMGNLIDAFKDNDVVCEGDKIKVLKVPGSGNGKLKVTKVSGSADVARSRCVDGLNPLAEEEGCPTLQELCTEDGPVFAIEGRVALYCGSGECFDLIGLAQTLEDAAQDGTLIADYDAFLEDVSEIEDDVCNVGLGTVNIQSPVTVSLVTADGTVYEREINFGSVAVYRNCVGVIAVVMGVLMFVY